MLFSAPRPVRFWWVFGPFGAAVPLRFAILRPALWGFVFGFFPSMPSPAPSPTQPSPQRSPGRPSSSQPTSAPSKCQDGASHGQPKPAQPSPQSSPVQLSPASVGMGLIKALPKSFSDRIQRCRFRPRDRSGFGGFLARLGPPCRCVSPFGTTTLELPLPSIPVSRAAQPTAQPSPGQPSPA